MQPPTRLTVFTHKPPINLCACQVKLCPSPSFVHLSSRKTGHYFPRIKGGHCADQRVKQRKKQSPVIACHQTEQWFKMQDRGRVWQRILLTSQGRYNHLSSKKSRSKSKRRRRSSGGGKCFQEDRDSLELDVTHTKQWRIKRLGCLWPFEGKRWGSAHRRSGAEAYWFQTVYLYHRQQPTQTTWTTLSPTGIRSVKPSWQRQDEHDVNMDKDLILNSSIHPSIHPSINPSIHQ